MQRLAQLRSTATVAVVTLIAVAAAAVILCAWMLTQSSAANRMDRQMADSAEATRQVTFAASALLQSVTDAETSQRAYVLAGRQSLLQPYAAAKSRARQAQDQLGRVTDHRAYAARAARVRRLAAARLDALEDTAALARAGRRAEFLARFEEGEGMMDALHSDVLQLLAQAEREDLRLRNERRRLHDRLLRLQTGLVSAAVLAFAIAVAALGIERAAARRAALLHRRLSDEIDAARRAAEVADHAKSRFLAAASHDMRQPLHALALYISALERRVGGGEARDILSNMQAAVGAMSRSFTALLDLARLEAGVLKPEPVDFAIADLLEDVADYSIGAPGAGSVRVVIAPTALRVRTDPDLLEIVLRNLASNAVKHSRGGRVLLGCRRVCGAVRVEVRDDGEGIPEAEIGELFGEFIRGERAGGAEGVGLGLAIVERISKLLGHPLMVRSELGRGSVFAVTVPRAGAGAARAVERSNPPSPPPTSLRGARILLADDEPLALDAMRRTLSDAGAVVVTASSASAVEAQMKRAFDLYIFDLNFGESSGLSLLDRIERERKAQVRGLVVTGATAPDALTALKGEGRRWLTKPILGPDLLAAAAQMLAER